MSRLADDWADWATACARREPSPESAEPTEVQLTFSVLDREVDRMRVDIASGQELVAQVVPLFEARG